MAGNLSKSFYMAVVFSVTVVALAAGYNHSPSTPESAPAVADEVSQVSQGLVGKRITVRGEFSLRCKITEACVSVDNHKVVYLVHGPLFKWGDPYFAMEGKLVTATGTLRFYRSPDAKPTKRSVARPPDYFYLEADTPQVRLLPDGK